MTVRFIKHENIDPFYIIYVNYLHIMRRISTEPRVDRRPEETPCIRKADWQRTVHTLFMPSINALDVQKLPHVRTNEGHKS